MKIRFVIICLLCNFAFGVGNNQASQNLGDLMTKITKINNDLDKKQQKQKSLDNAISDSRVAIYQFQKTLESIRILKDADTSQVKQIAEILPNIESATANIQNHVKTTISLIYQQIKVIETESSTVFSGNDWQLNNRKQQYLIRLLNFEASKYEQLQTKLNQLKDLNNKLSNELIRLNKEIGMTSQKSEQLKQIHQSTLGEKQHLQGQIAKEQQQLTDLKHKQAVLSMLMKDIDLDTKQYKLQKKQANINSKPNNQVTETLNGSPFFDRKLVKPLNTSVSIPFGAMRHGTKNNGVLYEAHNVPVFAISDGIVVYVGVLPGLGNLIVVNHGDNYMSIYAGIIPNASKGKRVSSGDVIANSGIPSNQPMGGVYFELRHAGIPVNPKELVE